MKTTLTKQRIFATTKELFFTYGYSKVTMDEITHKLGISKKTIYQYYTSKRVILSDIVKNMQTKMSEDIENLLQNPQIDFKEKLRQYLSIITFHISSISARFASDLQLHAPDIWREWQNHKTQAAKVHFVQLLREGTESGYVKKDINIYVTVITFLAAIDQLFDLEYQKSHPDDFIQNLPRLPLDKFNSVIKIIYEGILADETKPEFIQ
ncbi:MAG: TetR/AcrR family transcriptional regulator [Lentimicrobiaceae bacterium]|nr:TetR/AcrR family transcriptional regulator [Lentimicrobiaceae bacterium]